MQTRGAAKKIAALVDVAIHIAAVFPHAALGLTAVLVPECQQ
jgi:hypothetical protein